MGKKGDTISANLSLSKDKKIPSNSTEDYSATVGLNNTNEENGEDDPIGRIIKLKLKKKTSGGSRASINSLQSPKKSGDDDKRRGSNDLLNNSGGLDS